MNSPSFLRFQLAIFSCFQLYPHRSGLSHSFEYTLASCDQRCPYRCERDSHHSFEQDDGGTADGIE